MYNIISFNKYLQSTTPGIILHAGNMDKDSVLREHNRGGKLVQSTLYTSMELSQWNPLILSMYANKK